MKRLLLALLVIGALSGCQDAGITAKCHKEYQNDYLERGKPSDMGEDAYVKNCIDGVNVIGNEVNHR